MLVYQDTAIYHERPSEFRALENIALTAIGSFVCFPMVWSMAGEACAYASDVAQRHGLVCYDPQLERLRPRKPGAPAPGFAWFPLTLLFLSSRRQSFHG